MAFKFARKPTIARRDAQAALNRALGEIAAAAEEFADQEAEAMRKLGLEG